MDRRVQEYYETRKEKPRKIVDYCPPGMTSSGNRSNLDLTILYTEYRLAMNKIE